MPNEIPVILLLCSSIAVCVPTVYVTIVMTVYILYFNLLKKKILNWAFGRYDIFLLIKTFQFNSIQSYMYSRLYEKILVHVYQCALCRIKVVYMHNYNRLYFLTNQIRRMTWLLVDLPNTGFLSHHKINQEHGTHPFMKLRRNINLEWYVWC